MCIEKKGKKKKTTTTETTTRRSKTKDMKVSNSVAQSGGSVCAGSVSAGGGTFFHDVIHGVLGDGRVAQSTGVRAVHRLQRGEKKVEISKMEFLRAGEWKEGGSLPEISRYI